MTDSPDDAAQDPSVIDGDANGERDGRKWCRACRQWVVPRGKGQCEKGHLLREHSASRKHPVNITRRNRRLAKVKVDYQVDESSTVRMAWAEALADILEQLVSTRAGTMEYQRLITLSKELDAELRASRDSQPEGKSAIEEAADTLASLDDDALLAHMEGLVEELRNEREARRAREAAAAASSGAKLEPPAATPEASAPEPPPPPPCRYCHLPPSECEALKTSRPDDWRIVHPDAPPTPTYDLRAFCQSNAGLLRTDIFRPGGTTPYEDDQIMNALRRHRKERP